MANTVRTSISVPTDLKAKMDAIEETINWSAVACAAFEAKVAEIITKRKAKDMTDVIARLRASKRKHEDHTYELGHSAGKDWARNQAEVPELQRLESLHDQYGHTHEWDLIFSSDDTSAYGVGEGFYFTIQPNDNGDRQAAEEFWQANTGGDDRGRELMSDDSYVRGFAEGALAVWDEVKDQL